MKLGNSLDFAFSLGTGLCRCFGESFKMRFYSPLKDVERSSYAEGGRNYDLLFLVLRFNLVALSSLSTDNLTSGKSPKFCEKDLLYWVLKTLAFFTFHTHLARRRVNCFGQRTRASMAFYFGTLKVGLWFHEV